MVMYVSFFFYFNFIFVCFLRRGWFVALQPSWLIFEGHIIGGKQVDIRGKSQEREQCSLLVFPNLLPSKYVTLFLFYFFYL